jgi:hypothetical protein
MPNWYWRSMMWTMGMQKPSLKSALTFNDLTGKFMDGALTMHSPTIGIAGNEFMGHDFAFWFPDPSLGDEATIKAEMAKVNRRGGHVVPYINPIYTWENFPNTPHSEDPEWQERYKKVPADVKQPTWEIYKNHTARDYAGNYNPVETHYYGSLPEMCMADKVWQDYVLWWTHRYATEYGFSGVQWDQLGAYPMAYCTDWSHGHQHGGTGPYGTVELTRRIYEDPKYKVSPDFYIWYEGGSDCVSEYCQNGHSTWDGWNAYTFPSMIQYTFQGNTYGGEYQPPDGSIGNVRVKQRRNAEFSFLGRYKLGAGAGPHANRITQVAVLTNAIKGIYWYTNFKDNLGCIAPDGMWTNVLQIDPKVCPYVGKDGYIIPYADMRKDRAACEIKLSKKLYNLSDIEKVYWYPSHLQGYREQISFDNSNPDYLIIKLPDLGVLNLYSYDDAYCNVDNTLCNIGAIVIAKQELHPMKILAPGEVKRGREFTFKAVEQRIVGDEATASVTLGEMNREDGLAQVDVSDGPARPAIKAGEECLVTSTDKPYIYLKVNNPAMKGRESVVEVTIRYFDEGKDTLRLQYNSSDPYAIPYGFDAPVNQDHKGSVYLYKQDTHTWKTATFLLPDALFRGRMSNSADLRVVSVSGVDYIASVRVTKKAVKYTPVPNATVCVGNDVKVTDRHGILKYKFSPTDPTGVYTLDAYKEGPDGYLPATGLIKL